MSGRPIRVLVVDDSVVVRRLLTTTIDADPDLEVVATAPDGAAALERIERLEPDAVTLDVEMPVMDGLTALRHIRARWPRLPVVMFSTTTERGAEATLDALASGASDYVTKPANVGSVGAAMEAVRAQLAPKLKALCPRATAATGPAGAPTIAAPPRRPATGRTSIVAIGSSTGGPEALAAVLGALPVDLAVPVVCVQHMPPVFTRLLAERLDATCGLEVVEGADGDPLLPGRVTIAPGDLHATVVGTPGAPRLATGLGDPVNFCRPSVDVLLDSLAAVHGGDVLAVVLTGMGTDGRAGCAALRDRGAHVVVQDEASSVVWGMPGAVARAGLADEVLDIAAIAPAVVRHLAATGPATAIRRREAAAWA